MFNILFIIVPIFMVVMIFFTFGMIFSPKLRSKFMGHQLKMQKQMLEDNKEVLKDINTISGGIGIQSKRDIIDENEEALRHMTSKEASIKAEAVKTTARAFKEGFSGEDTGKVYCKHCGVQIDDDSAFCKKCGNKQ